MKLGPHIRKQNDPVHIMGLSARWWIDASVSIEDIGELPFTPRIFLHFDSGSFEGFSGVLGINVLEHLTIVVKGGTVELRK